MLPRSIRRPRQRSRASLDSPAVALLLATALAGVSGCGGPESDAADVTSAVADSTGGGTMPSAAVTMLDPVDVADVLGRGGIRIIDVRTPAEFAEGHIAGAELVDISQPDFVDRIAALDPAGTYFVYCRSDNRSGVATELMLDMGFTSLYELRGGTVAWQEAGLPLDRG